MVFKKSFCLLGVLVLHSFFSHPCFAQNDAKQFTQVIEWEYVDYAMHYEIVLEKNTTLNEWEVYDTFDVTTNLLELTLNAGNYRYNVTVYNIFGRAEQTSDWYTFTIEKALQPVVADIFPKELELPPAGTEESNAIIALNPRDVSDEATFFLKGKNEDETLYGDFVGFDENGMMQIEFNTEQLDSGDYELIIQDPSGLTSENISTPSLVNVERAKPQYFNLSLGYSYALFPQIENTLYSDYDFPAKNITIRTKFSYVPFVSLKSGNLGFELSASILNNNFIAKDIDMTGFIFPITLNVAYHKPIGEKFVLVTHLGAGLTFLSGFMEWNTATVMQDAASIALSSGLMGQIYIGEKFYFELGADYIYSVFLDSTSFHTVLPTLSLGWKFD